MTPRPPEVPVVDEGPRDGPDDALVLDIGGDTGALILYAQPALIGAELDLTPAGQPRSHGIHTAIRRRRAGGHDVVCGVYPSVPAGRYVVWGLDGTPLVELDVVGGQVAEATAGG